jgi:DnaA family protein
MEQLSLEVRLADYALFETFYAGPNAGAVHELQNFVARGDSTVLWLRGAVGTGKSHLLQACVNAADARGLRAAYLPLGPEFEMPPAALEGFGQLDVICIDDVDSIAGQNEWEQGLFGLFENLARSGGRLVLAARRSPLHCEFSLRDLASRFSSGPTFRLTPIEDEDKLKAMQLRAKWRGLTLSDDTGRYLITRVDRGFGQLFTLLDELDREALAAQRRLTIPFVKSVLEK